MKTYEIKFTQSGNTHFVKTEATSDQVQEAIDFVKRGAEQNIEKLLQALRILGFKATEVKVEAIDVFEV